MGAVRYAYRPLGDPERGAGLSRESPGTGRHLDATVRGGHRAGQQGSAAGAEEQSGVDRFQEVSMHASPLRSAPKQTLPTAFHIMTKPIGPICNLDCKYCFYLEKEGLYQEERKARPSWQMPDEILESYIRQYIEQQEIPEISFAWQGGEPTLLGVRFFRKVVELQRQYAGAKRILNALQTNG